MVSFEFQKGSPYIEDFDFLIDMKDQMGLEFSGEGIANYVPNATRCMRWEQVKASHSANNDLVIRIEQIFGMLLLLSLGIAAGFTTFIAESLIFKIMRRRINNSEACPKRAWKTEEKAPTQDSEAAMSRRFWLVAYE